MDVKGKFAIVTGAAQGLGKSYAETLLKKGAKDDDFTSPKRDISGRNLTIRTDCPFACLSGMDVHGKIALITGSARGLGKSYAEALLKKGAKVVISDILEKEGRATEAEFRASYGHDHVIFILTDVTKQQDMEDLYDRIISEYGYIDIVINNAAVSVFAEKEAIFQVNLFGVIRSCELAVPRMRVDGGGRGGVIVNISSIGGIYTDNLGDDYQASKHGVTGYSGSLGKRLSKESSGIRVHTLCPGCVKTDMSKRHQEMEDAGDPEIFRILEKFGGWVPISRVADVCLQLIETEVPSGSIVKADNDGGQIVDTDNVPLIPL